MPSKTAVPYRNEWVMMPTLASASGVHWPSNQHTVSPAGRAARSAACGSVGAVAGGFSVSMAASIRGGLSRSRPSRIAVDPGGRRSGAQVLRRVRQQGDVPRALQRGRSARWCWAQVPVLRRGSIFARSER